MITFGAHVIPNLADECLFKLVPLICPFEHFAFWYKIWALGSSRRGAVVNESD